MDFVFGRVTLFHNFGAISGKVFFLFVQTLQHGTSTRLQQCAVFLDVITICGFKRIRRGANLLLVCFAGQRELRFMFFRQPALLPPPGFTLVCEPVRTADCACCDIQV